MEAVRDPAGQVIDFVYRELNLATCDYLGLPRADLLGRGIVEIMPGLELTELLAGYIRCLNTGEPLVLDDFSYDNEILLDTRRYNLRATRATPTSIAATWRDVTERFQLAQRFSESEARSRLLIDTATIAMNVSGPDGKLESVNDAMCHLFGYDAEMLTQMTWQELAAPEYLAADTANFEAILAGQIDSYRMTMEFVHADGHRFWGNLSVSCIRLPNGDVDQFAAQIIDTTSEVQLAERLKVQADRLAADLRSAANYITSILPADVGGPLSVSSRYLPSQELAGDTFDHRWVDDDHLIVYLIDVSGHGIEAALLSVSVHNMLRSGSLPLATLLSPERVLSELNSRFQMDQHGEHYFTIWFGVYEASTRTLRYASAGAPPAFVLEFISATTGTAAELSTSGAPIGMFTDTVFTAVGVVTQRRREPRLLLRVGQLVRDRQGRRHRGRGLGLLTSG